MNLTRSTPLRADPSHSPGSRTDLSGGWVEVECDDCAARAAARDAASGRLALYLAHGEAASEEPVPDIREVIDA